MEDFDLQMGIPKAALNSPQDWASRPHGQDLLNEFSGRRSNTKMNSPQIPLCNQPGPQDTNHLLKTDRYAVWTFWWYGALFEDSQVRQWGLFLMPSLNILEVNCGFSPLLHRQNVPLVRLRVPFVGSEVGRSCCATKPLDGLSLSQRLSWTFRVV